MLTKEENENKQAFYERIIKKQDEEFLAGIGGTQLDVSTEIR